VPKILKNVRRDKTNKIELEKLGWEVIILWECQLDNANKETTLNNLRTLLQ